MASARWKFPQPRAVASARGGRSRAIGVALGTALFAVQASGSTLRVPQDFPTLWQACDASAPGDTILVASGVYSEAVERGLYESVCFPRAGTFLIGVDGAEVTRIEPPASASGVFILEQDGPVSIRGFTIVVRPPGGIRVRYSQGVAVEDCQFLESATGDGGSAVWTDQTSLSVHRSRFTGLVGSSVLSASGPIHIQGCEFVSNDSGDMLLFDGYGSVAMIECKILDNQGRIVEFDRYGTALLLDNHFEGNFEEDLYGYAIGVANTDLTLSRNTFVGNDWGYLCTAAGYMIIRIHDNLFWRNRTRLAALHPWNSQLRVVRNAFVEHSGTILSNGSGSVYDWNQNIFAFSPEGGTLSSGDLPEHNECNVYWGNVDDPFLNWPQSPTDIFEDPLFCDRESGDFRVSSQSPCLPGSNACEDWIGPLQVGCGSVAIDPTTWARIKASHRTTDEAR